MRRRRNLLIVTAAVLLSEPFAGIAQPQAKTWRIGFLSARRRPASLQADYYGAFLAGMRDLGYVEGKNLTIEWRFAEGDYARLPGLASELVHSKVDAILALGPPAVIAAQQATSTIPIVIVSSIDPVRAGFVRSLARPGGNITGLSNLAADISTKHLEMLLTVMPRLSRMAVLVNPNNEAHASLLKQIQDAAERARVKLLPLRAQTPQEIDSAFSAVARQDAEAIVIGLDPLFIQQEAQIAGHALRQRLPSIFSNREYVEAGGFMSYGQNQSDIYRRAAAYVDRIFNGASPGELPIEQPTRLELAINLKTAKALGITIPQELLLRADIVIQ